MLENELNGDFSVEKWSQNFEFMVANRGKAKYKFYVMLNPYNEITTCGKTPLDLKIGFKIKDENGVIIKLIEFGHEGLFGKDRFSWIWLGFKLVNSKFTKT